MATAKVNEMEPSEIMIDGSLVYGRDKEKKRIIEHLLSNDCSSQGIALICISSPNGIGKTTMAQLIYTDKRVVDAFDTRVFVRMPEKCDEKRLIKGIIEGLTCTPCDITELSILKSIVEDEVMGTKVLLVLDGAESESFLVYLSFLHSVAHKESVVLVTTNSLLVSTSEAVKCCYLSCLSDYECRLIFQQLAFNGHDRNAQPELVEIGKHLIAKCENNTLCIKMLGGLLFHLASVESWRAVLESEVWDMDEDDESIGEILPAIRLCYEFLPNYLKQCFAYCSLFPKNYIFSKHYLVRLWLSQGFIEFEDIGIRYFEELCSRFFFQHPPLHDTKEDMFFMHGLVHNLAESVSIKECFRYEDYPESTRKGIYHLSFAPCEYQTVPLNSLIAEARDLRSFLVINGLAIEQYCAPSPIIDLVNLNDAFGKLICLRTLDLSNTGIEDLPNSIGFLGNLHYLGLNNTNIRSIPPEIGNLVGLQSLEARDCYYLVELPETIQLLVNLQNLDVRKETGYVNMSVGIRKLTNLQSLPAFNVGSSEKHCGIEELKNLDGLKRRLQISRLENVNNVIGAKEANLKSKTYLETLTLEWSDNTAFIEDEEDVETQETVLENLQPSNNLDELIIRNYVGGQFPLWVGNSSFTKLASVILDGCSNCSVFPVLSGLPSLRLLSLQKMYGVERIDLSSFPSLDLLKLWEMYGLKELVGFRNGCFCHVHSLSISKCPLLRNIPHFPSLQELSIHYCNQIQEFPDLPSLEFLKIEGLQKTETLNLSGNLSALKNLEVCHCPELSSVQYLSLPTSIEKIRLIQCPKLVDWNPNNLKREAYSSMIIMKRINSDIKKVDHQHSRVMSGVQKGEKSTDYEDMSVTRAKGGKKEISYGDTSDIYIPPFPTGNCSFEANYTQVFEKARQNRKKAAHHHSVKPGSRRREKEEEIENSYNNSPYNNNYNNSAYNNNTPRRNEHGRRKKKQGVQMPLHDVLPPFPTSTDTGSNYTEMFNRYHKDNMSPNAPAVQPYRPANEIPSHEPRCCRIL